MIVSMLHRRHAWRPIAGLALLGLGFGLAGCAVTGDSLTEAFADPAKYEYYDCKQLEAERKSLAQRADAQKALMAKADSGVAGPVVAEMVYRNELIAIRGQTRFADEAWRRNKCQDSPPPVAPTAPTPPVIAPAPPNPRGAH